MVLRLSFAGYFSQETVLLYVLSACWFVLGPQEMLADNKVSYQKDIRPILSDHCFACHGPDSKERKGDLRLDVDLRNDRAELLNLGNPDHGEIWERITSTDSDVVMPPLPFISRLTRTNDN